jgi:hypothetical protein
MAIDPKRGQMGEVPRPLGERSAPKPEMPADRTPFGGRQNLRESDIRDILRSDRAYDKTGMYESERLERGKRLFGSAGDFFSPEKARKILNDLRQKKAYAPIDKERGELDKDIKVAEFFLKE